MRLVSGIITILVFDITGMMDISKKSVGVLLILTIFSTMLLAQPQQLWYDRPAEQWEETLPLGNGRLGMMPDGGINSESIVLNDITLWSGSPQDANNYQASAHLPKIRQLLIEGKNDKAQRLVDEHFVCEGPGSGGARWGCFQVLGTLHLQVDHDADVSTSPLHYRRTLNIDEAIASLDYELDGVSYRREYFTGFGDDVGIIRFTADQPGKLNLRVSLSRPERFVTGAEGNELQLYGQLDNGTDGKGMRYLTRVRAVLEGGTRQVTGDSLVITGATAVILYVSSVTDFRDADYRETSARLLAAAMEKNYDSHLKTHISAYQRLFHRVSLKLGPSVRADLPTNERLVAFKEDSEGDNELATLFFQVGRYLSISSTRVGLLPPNLQGLWANQIQTPWNGDYHLDVNVQMNHWHLGPANLGELNLPLAELVRGLTGPGARTARIYYDAEGWVAHVITNVWGFTEPGESASWGASNAGSGWLCNNLWEHYAFSKDTAYLRSIYPILKGSAKFYNSVLMEDPKTGWLVTGPSVSPENAFYLPNGNHANICMGPTIDNQITRELFMNVIDAASILGVDVEFCNTLREKLERLPPPGQIGSDGRILEWLEEYKEVDPEHRHISHLYGLYPANLISPYHTPELAEAAKKTLEVRGDDGPSWAIAYKQIFWARLLDGNRAYKLLRQLLTPTKDTHINYGAGGGIYPNFFTAGPPMQIDGNFGGAAGIAEMLLQSHNGMIELLPALPDAWKAEGEFKGFKARGNFTVDVSWKDGKVVQYRVASPNGGRVKVKVNGEIKEIQVKRI